VGGISYVWLYDTLSGSPGPGGSGATLTLNEDTHGSTNIGVQAQQQWKDQNGNLATTNSPTSTNVFVDVQQPDSISFWGSAPYNVLGTNGGIYSWQLLDTDGIPIANTYIEFTETITLNGGAMVVTDIRGTILQTIPPTDAAPTSTTGDGDTGPQTTDDSGVFQDGGPQSGGIVGPSSATLILLGQQSGQTINVVTIWEHTYDTIITPDGSIWGISMNPTWPQTQTITDSVTRKGAHIRTSVYTPNCVSTAP